MSDISMLRRLTKGIRVRAAATLVLAYALCSLAPAAALALSIGQPLAPCITEDHRSPADVHAHAGHHHAGHTHDHGGHNHASDDGDDDSTRSGCCGFTCLPGMPASFAEFSSREPMAVHLVITAESLTGRGSERLSRPPDSSLSM